MCFLSPSLSIIMFGGLLLLATTFGYYFCVPIGRDDDESSKTQSRSGYDDSPESLNHFCSRMYSGDFEEDIHLQSFSPRRTHIRMFENGNMYMIPLHAVEEHKIELPEQYSKFSLNKTLGGYKPDDLQESDVISIYDIRLGNKDCWWIKYYLFSKVIAALYDGWTTLKRPLIVIASTGEFIWNLVFPWGGQGEIMASRVRYRPDYALVFRQSGDSITGYVINQDIYGPNHDYIIYDLSLPWESLQPNVQSRDTPNEDKSTAPYYYLQKTENPNEILLVHREKYEEVDEKVNEGRQLFHSLPLGFVHEFPTDFQIFIYLFDTELGCVYVLDDLLSLNEKFQTEENLVVSRINIPFEQFFECPEQYRTIKHKLNPARCNTTITVGESFFTANWKAIIGIISIVLLIGAFGCYLYYQKQGHKKIQNSPSSESDKADSPPKKKKVLRKKAVTPIRKKSPKGVPNSYSKYKAPSQDEGTTFESPIPKKSPGKKKRYESTIMIMSESSFKNSPISDPVRHSSED